MSVWQSTYGVSFSIFFLTSIFQLLSFYIINSFSPRSNYLFIPCVVSPSAVCELKDQKKTIILSVVLYGFETFSHIK